MQSYIQIESQILYSPILEEDCLTVHFYGCNFRCPYCNQKNYTEFNKDNLVNLADVKKFITQNYYDVDIVLFTGGEPCLQRQALLNLARFCKRLKMKVAVHTNASKPDTIKSLVREELIDYLIVDIKSPLSPDIFEKVTKSKTFFQTSDKVIAGVDKTLDLVRKTNIKTIFVTVVVPGLIFRKEDFVKIASKIKDHDADWVLESFKPGDNVLDKRFAHIDLPRRKFRDTLARECIKNFPQLNIRII